MRAKTTVKLTKEELIKVLQKLSQEELQEILQELAKRDITIKPVKMQKIVERLKGKISIGGDAVKEAEKLYE